VTKSTMPSGSLGERELAPQTNNVDSGTTQPLLETPRPSDAPFWCRDCGRRWASLVEVHCAVCHLHFSHYSSFDKHLSGVENVKHRDPSQMHRKSGDPVFESTQTPHGITWHGYAPGPHPFA